MEKRKPSSKKRSLIKAVTFRIAVVVVNTFVVFIITKRVNITIGVIFFSNVTSTILYFFHERIWNNVDLD